MATILTNKFKVRNAKAFMELFRTNNVYLFIGRNRAWSDEANPPTPSNLTALSDELDVWNDIIVMKKVSISDVSLVIPRYNYDSGTSYTEYEHDKTDLFTRDGDPTNPFYVVKQEYSGMYTVWKCVANVKNTAPTSEPTWANGISATHFRDNLSNDGYLWKYMYRITSNDMTKFGTTAVDSTGNKWMPVKNVTTAGVQHDTNSQWDVQRQAVPGGVHFIRPTSAIISGDATKKVRLDGDGTGFDATHGALSTSQYYATAHVVQQYRIGVPASSYKLIDVWPQTVDAVDLAWDTNDAIMEFGVTLRFNGMEGGGAGGGGAAFT